MLAAALATSACQTTPTTATTKPVCLIWLPITFSAMDDTVETVQQIRENNAARDSYCDA